MTRLFKVLIGFSTLGAVCSFSIFGNNHGGSSNTESLFLATQNKTETPDDAFNNYVGKYKKNYKTKTEFA